MPGRHRLRIGRWHTRLRASPGTAALWAARMDTTMRGPAARALGAALEDRLEGQQAIVRIDRITLTLPLCEALASGGDLAGEIGRRLAERIMAALDRAEADPGVRIWPDRASHAAAYALHRLGLRPAPGWAFVDFAPLDRLTGPEAAAEALATAGGAALRPLARSGIAAPVLAHDLGAAGALRLLIALARAGKITEAALQHAAGALVWPDPPPDLPAQHLLTAVLCRDIGPQGLDPPGDPQGPPIADLVRATLALHLLAARRAAGEPLAAIRADPARGGATASGAAPAAAALAEIAADPGLWARALSLTAPAARPPAAPAVGAQTSPGATAAAPPPFPGLCLHSAFAGLALALPLCPCPEATPETLWRIALGLLDPEDLPRAARDAGVCTLFPADPQRPPLPLPAPDPALWHDQGTLAGAAARDGLDAWSDLWLARIAARLQGLQGSSRGYLRREFLCRSGRIEPDAPEAPLRLVLAPMPLGIVVRLSGLTGLTAPIPHLGGRRLLIDLEV